MSDPRDRPDDLLPPDPDAPATDEEVEVAAQSAFIHEGHGVGKLDAPVGPFTCSSRCRQLRGIEEDGAVFGKWIEEGGEVKSA